MGRALLARLGAAGHEPRVLTRGIPRAPAERRWDPAALAPDAIEGAAAIVHLAGATIATRWTAARRREIRASRVESTRAIVAAMSRVSKPPRVLICASAVGIYGDRGDEWLDEESALGTGFLAELARDWEAEAARAGALGVRVVSLRFGIVLDRSGGVLARMMPLFRLGLGGAPGSGRQWWSWIAVEDVVRLVIRALDDATLHGALNATAPQPVTAREFASALGRALARPAIAPAPAPLLRLAFGEMADQVLLASQRVAPRRLAAARFDFRHPTLEGALAAACRS